VEKPAREVNATDEVDTRLKSRNLMFHMVIGVGDGESAQVIVEVCMDTDRGAEGTSRSLWIMRGKW
jgi:hypothetical protein